MVDKQLAPKDGTSPISVDTTRRWRDSFPGKKKVTETNPAERTQLERAADALLRSGYLLFALAIVALGIETFVCTGQPGGEPHSERPLRKNIRADPRSLRRGPAVQAYGADGRAGAGESAVSG